MWEKNQTEPESKRLQCQSIIRLHPIFRDPTLNFIPGTKVKVCCACDMCAVDTIHINVLAVAWIGDANERAVHWPSALDNPPEIERCIR